MGIQIIVLRDGEQVTEIGCNGITIHQPLNPEHVHITSENQATQTAHTLERILIIAVKDACAANGQKLLRFQCTNYHIENGVLNVLQSHSHYKKASFPLAEICGCWYEDAIALPIQAQALMDALRDGKTAIPE